MKLLFNSLKEHSTSSRTRCGFSVSHPQSSLSVPFPFEGLSFFFLFFHNQNLHSCSPTALSLFCSWILAPSTLRGLFPHQGTLPVPHLDLTSLLSDIFCPLPLSRNILFFRNVFDFTVWSLSCLADQSLLHCFTAPLLPCPTTIHVLPRRLMLESSPAQFHCTCSRIQDVGGAPKIRILG